ncbi:MAG: AraC family transcriptional regulator [Dyadobacter sp.]|uniref:AraC family transcriptional regulator n=1 Tax=Dyadobacter sp. TaxID=1914288 RepID=UPI003267717D
MYFTSLPDHNAAGFNEEAHFGQFKKHNVIFNAVSSDSHCDDHVGCLSFKTVLSGEEWYGIGQRKLAVRPGLFLILNNEQNYSCRIDAHEKVRCFSIFFKNDFAISAFRDLLQSEESSLDNPFQQTGILPEFFQTLNQITPEIQLHVLGLIRDLNQQGYSDAMVDEHLLYFMQELARTYRADVRAMNEVEAIKCSTRNELYKRLCIARDMLHSSYAASPDLNSLSREACMSIPQLIRQFKSVFRHSPHQYLMRIRLMRAAELLVGTNLAVAEIAGSCGFESSSAFSRAFKVMYHVQPIHYRKAGL